MGVGKAALQAYAVHRLRGGGCAVALHEKGGRPVDQGQLHPRERASTSFADGHGGRT